MTGGDVVMGTPAYMAPEQWRSARDVDGRADEATRRLKAGALSVIPIIALTAHAGREDQARAKAAGCDDYLTKPVERDHLIATIRQHLKARSATATSTA